MEKAQLQEKINEFLDKKKIEHSFFRECVTEFIEGHDRLFGEFVPTEDLFMRLYQNLDKITFVGFGGIESQGKYVKLNDAGEEQNEILLGFEEADLDVPEIPDFFKNEDKEEIKQKYEDMRKSIKSILLHELTHAAYTDQIEISGQKRIIHIFSTTIKRDPSNSYFFLMNPSASDSMITIGDTQYIEAIVNFISTEIEDEKKDGKYIYLTNAIRELANKIGYGPIIKSAWTSLQTIFEDAYINYFIKSLGFSQENARASFSAFDEDMKRLNDLRKSSDYTRQWGIFDNIQNILEGNKLLSIEEQTRNNSNEQLHSESANMDFMEIEPEPSKEIFEKNGLEDVKNTGILRSWLDRAICFVKNIYNKRNVQNNERDEIQ